MDTFDSRVGRAAAIVSVFLVGGFFGSRGSRRYLYGDDRMCVVSRHA
jgi:hypothetical protein